MHFIPQLLTRISIWITAKKKEQIQSPFYEFNIDPYNLLFHKITLAKDAVARISFNDFDNLFNTRIREADDFYNNVSATKDEDLRNIQRQAFAGMLMEQTIL